MGVHEWLREWSTKEKLYLFVIEFESKVQFGELEIKEE